MPYLAFNLNNGNEFIFDLEDARLSLGRNSRNEIVIDSSQISSFHAELLRRPDGNYEVVDLKSSNGTFVNGKRVERAVLRQGDKVRFGGLEAKFKDSADTEPSNGHPKSSGKSVEEKKREAERSGTPESKTEAVQLKERVAPQMRNGGGRPAQHMASTATSAVPVLRDSKAPFPAPTPSPAPRSGPSGSSRGRSDDEPIVTAPIAFGPSDSSLAMAPPSGLSDAPLTFAAPQGLSMMPPPASISATPPPAAPVEPPRPELAPPARGRAPSYGNGNGTEVPPQQQPASFKSAGGRQAAPSTATSAVPTLKSTRSVRVGPGAMGFKPPQLQSLESEHRAGRP